MDFNAPPIGIYIRIVAIISLMLGLNDAARLLGVNLGAVSPISITCMPPGSSATADEVLHQADDALYAAKNAGRNRVHVNA